MTDIWKTKDGREIPVTEMTETHIKNALNMIESRYPPVPPCFNGEMAQLCAEVEWENACSFMEGWMRIFKNELEKRKNL